MAEPYSFSSELHSVDGSCPPDGFSVLDHCAFPSNDVSSDSIDELARMAIVRDRSNIGVGDRGDDPDIPSGSDNFGDGISELHAFAECLRAPPVAPHPVDIDRLRSDLPQFPGVARVVISAESDGAILFTVVPSDDSVTQETLVRSVKAFVMSKMSGIQQCRWSVKARRSIFF